MTSHVEFTAEPEAPPWIEAGPDPRQAAFDAYRQRMLGVTCASIAVFGSLRDVLNGGPGGMPALVQNLQALDVLYADLGAAVQGLVAVNDSSGVA